MKMNIAAADKIKLVITKEAVVTKTNNEHFFNNLS